MKLSAKSIQLRALVFLAMGLAPQSLFGALEDLQPLPTHNILRLLPNPEPSNPELPATPGQFSSIATSSGGGEATEVGLKLTASIGRVFAANAPDFLFGDVISPPAVDKDGVALVGQTPTEYWRAEPLRAGEPVKIDGVTGPPPVASDENQRFYYSPHAGRAFASDQGRIRIVWRTRLPVDAENNFAILDSQYNISGSSRLPVRKVFWTEGRYSGPKVEVPLGIIQDVEIVYNSSLPEEVLESEAVLPPTGPGAPVEVRTLWFDDTQQYGTLRGINRTGRVLVEFLGGLVGDSTTLRRHLGIEVVDLEQEVRPVEVETLLGDQLLPKPDGITVDSDEANLSPLQINALSLGTRYTEQQIFEGREVYYAIYENDEPLRVQFYWMEEGLKGIRWPSYLNSYRLIWPHSIDDFPVQFARPANTDLSEDTFIALPRANTPQLVYQDDKDGSEASLDFQSNFLVDLRDGDDAVNRSLLKFTAGNDFWYVRVYSAPENILGDKDNSDTIDIQSTALVGDRIDPPSSVDSVAGYIDSSYGTAYNVGAYIDPFSEAGFEKAEEGSIIPVNALVGNDKLRVWWFKELVAPGDLSSVFEPIQYPSVIAEYTLSFPGNARLIVLASNEGSGELSSEEADGSIYFHNDPGKHGYNPNEEHALMLGGRAYALRDDLNLTDVSSDPFVLVDYTAGDGRPSMAVFGVIREDSEYTFNYSATAGTILQAPMPLPILPQPLDDRGKTKNREVPSSVEDRSPNPNVDGHYNRFTYEDRKGSHWIYRGPHRSNPDRTPELDMQFYYKTQAGFAFPANPSGTDFAPDVGSIVPYLRAYSNGSDRTGGFEGDSVSGPSFTVTYTPVWPEDVPELRFGETLSLPKFGLPQVRGQSSLQIIYQGSQTSLNGETPGPDSALLHDSTRQKIYFFSDGTDDNLAEIPGSVATTESRGKTYFQGLPTHLQERVYMDPNYFDSITIVVERIVRVSKDDNTEVTGKKLTVSHTYTANEITSLIDEDGNVSEKFEIYFPTDIEDTEVSEYFIVSTRGAEIAELIIDSETSELDFTLVKKPGNGAIVFKGEFVDEIAGEDYLMLNVLSDRELRLVKALCLSSDENKEKWDDAIDKLTTRLERFTENPNQPGTYYVDPETFQPEFKPQEVVALESPPSRADSTDTDNFGFFDEAVDSYALTAVGGGEGYVVLLAGNGLAFTSEEEPAVMHVLRVGGGLYTGELKPITASNPLSENVTVQHTGDFAGHSEGFEFEWRKGPPVNGLSPAVYENRHVQEPTNGVSFDIESESIADSATALPVEIAIDDGLSLSTAIDFRSSIPSDSKVAGVYFGLEFGEDDEVVVLIDGIEVIITSEDLPSGNLPDAVDSIMQTESSSRKVYFLSESKFASDSVSQIELIYSTNSPLGSESELDLRLAVAYREDRAATNYVLAARANGENRFLVAGSGIDTLGDNYYIMRYRPLSGHVLYPNHGYANDQEGWSDWTEPALVEGWIKRVLAGINPFNQRISDFYDNAINTDVSLLTQAGTRWEGDVALTLDNVQDAGLIEIYETVLKRGISLSIDGTPEVDYGPANDALLLAAGYLADLYMALGNEAYADASNPMILFDAQSIGTVANDSVAGGFEDLYRSTATSRFAFQGQVSSLLEEELHLLRGRDDFLSPSIEVSPAYNRLFWNYTRGIDAGEVIYALNYNITEKDGDDADGKIDAVDAQRQYPQGHGDAYGHYLTTLTNYYRLLADDQFTWGTRSEAVNILGQPVSVDYLDERKFAAAAAALGRTTRQIQTLEHRKAYLDAENKGWAHLDQTRENSRTGRIRRWGFDDWSARGGQMAYYNWITANAILPDEDSVNEGIQKIDRSTVPELDELAAAGSAIQRRMDSVDNGLNPLDLTNDSLVFDISPQAQENGETHFEQIYERSVRALNNAFDVFDRATDSSRLLRSLENQNQNLSAAVLDQENAFVTELLEVYGAPYPGDIGPGKTYPEGYEGPDLYRSFYIDRPFEIFQKRQLFAYEGGKREFTVAVKDDKLIASLADTPRNYGGFDNKAKASSAVTYSIEDDIGPYQFADSSFGKRSQIGSIQDSLAAVRLAEEQLYAGLAAMDNARGDFIDDLGDFEKDMNNRIAIMGHQNRLEEAKRIYEEIKVFVGLVRTTLDNSKDSIEELTAATVTALPRIVGFSNDVTSAARAALLAAKVGANTTLSAADLGQAWIEAIADLAFDAAEAGVKFTLLGLEDDDFWRAQGNELKSKYETARSAIRGVDALYTAYIRELERYRNEVAKGESVLSDREAYRKRASAVVQGYRTRDVAFRAFRTEALEQYQNLFDWAAKYAYLTAQAYDYETGLLGSDDGRKFLGGIASSRALGLLNDDGQPTFAASQNGDPGLSGFLARLKADWEVVNGRLGFNNPDVYGTTFSLRNEYFRIPDGASGDNQWRERLAQLIQPNLLANSTVAAHALQIDSSGGTPVPGIIVAFPTEIASGLNFFGKPLAAGDHRFTESNFATKIHSAGVVFENYEGMDPCLLCANNVPGHTVNDHGPNALSATPHVYLIPSGLDVMRTPPLGDSEALRQWTVLDHALPLPYDIGSIESTGGDAGFLSVGSRSLGEDFMAARRHQAFRAVDNAAFFVSNRSDEYTNSRLIGRSAVNTNWILVIPAIELLNDPEEGLRRFVETVSDIKIHLRTYSYSGN